MRRGLLIVVILLLSAPAAAGSGPVTAPTDSRDAGPAALNQLGNTQTNLLLLESDRRSRFASPSIDVAMSTAIQRERTGATLDRYTLETALERAETSDQRSSILLTAARQARDRLVQLREREAALRTAFHNGSIDAESYARELAMTRTRAAALQTQVTAIRAASQGDDTTVRSLVEMVESRVIEYQGPVRDRTLAAVQGETVPVGLYVSVSPNGSVLSMIDDGRYVREAYRSDRQSATTVQIPFETVVSRMQTTYPTALNQSTGWGISYLSGGGVYRLDFEPGGTSLTAYLHGDTQEVYYEIREENLDDTGSSLTASVVGNDTRLVVNRSYRGGPLRIATVDNSTGEPVEATVFVEDVRRETGPDGVVWTLTPDSLQFSVTAVRPSGNVTVLVRAIEPVGIEADQ